MAQYKFGAAGVTSREIDLSGPLTTLPSGTPAGIVGTAVNGPAFVPVVVGNLGDWVLKFGEVKGDKFGPLAVAEWLTYAKSVAYLRVLGVGDGKMRKTDGSVNHSGFLVGDEVPDVDNYGYIGKNNYANYGGPLGRTYFLGCFMSESNSTVFSEAGLQGAGSPVASYTGNKNSSVPIIRGVLMAPSGVILRLSSSLSGIVSNAPGSSFVASEASSFGTTVGDVVLTSPQGPKQDFVLVLNGHKGTDSNYPNVITASFADPEAENYFSKKFNTDPSKIQQAGHYLYASWGISNYQAAVTGSGLISSTAGVGATGLDSETAAFLVTSSLSRKTSSTTVPNYEGFVDRFSHAVSPWVISQKFGGKPVNLFRLHALDDGAGPSTQYKITISGLTPAKTNDTNKYGNFSITVKPWSSNDSDTKGQESFLVSLDPTSDIYIAKQIGDRYGYYDFDREESEQKLVIEGNYPNLSNYIRVEVSSDVENGFVDPTALPVGFRGISHLVTSGSAPLAKLNGTYNSTFASNDVLCHSVTPPLPFRSKITSGAEWTMGQETVAPLNWGVKFEIPLAANQKNDSLIQDASIQSFASYFPGYEVGKAKFAAGDNAGVADTAANGIMDSDRFCNNLFTLENIQVVTASNGYADPDKWNKAVYARKGNVGSLNLSEIAADNFGDENKLRGFKVEDLYNNSVRLKFNMILQGGFDGVNIFDKDSLELNNAAVHAEMDSSAGRGLNEGPSVKSYLKALEIMSNTVNLDIQLLAIPGIREPIVTDAAILAVQDRFDALYIMDIEQLDEDKMPVEPKDKNKVVSVTNTVSNFEDRSLNSSFAAAYFPDISYQTAAGTTYRVPPSVCVLGAISNNDYNGGYSWYAPAGLNRALLSRNAIESNPTLYRSDLDKLYNANINPITTYTSNSKNNLSPSSSLAVWGQKTLLATASALDRINVRRLLIEIRRQVRDIAQTIIFEPNRAATLAKFSAAITPQLQRIQKLNGIQQFKVVIDSSTTTQNDIENNTIRGKIFVQPTKTIEFVSLDFAVSNNLPTP